jgi:hypothetical protein
LQYQREKGKLWIMKKEVVLQKALNVWALILIFWSLYRANFQMPDWFDEFIAKPIFFILPVYFYLTKVEKVNFFSGLDWKLKTTGKNLLIGLAVGGFFS